jgi:hypothetical protein
LAIRVAVGALAVLALILLGSLPAENPDSRIERLVVPGSAPAIVLDGHGKWSGYTR